MFKLLYLPPFLQICLQFFCLFVFLKTFKYDEGNYAIRLALKHSNSWWHCCQAKRTMLMCVVLFFWCATGVTVMPETPTPEVDTIPGEPTSVPACPFYQGAAPRANAGQLASFVCACLFCVLCHFSAAFFSSFFFFTSGSRVSHLHQS